MRRCCEGVSTDVAREAESSASSRDAFACPSFPTLGDDVKAGLEPDKDASSAIPLAVGTLFAERYRLQSIIGEGAFGRVFAAFDEGPLQRRVALKIMRPQGFAEARGVEEIETLKAQFLQEIRFAGRLIHPHIATVFDAGSGTDQPLTGSVATDFPAIDYLYMVQELVSGRDLSRLMADEGELSPEFVLVLARQLTAGLSYAHRQGILHRDIKPGNLLVDEQHQLKIVDFGLASAFQTGLPNGLSKQGEEAAGAGAEREASPSHEHTPEPAPGLGGTPGYASPEQIRGESADARTDVFSAACVLYALLTGHSPFRGQTVAARLRKTLLSPVEPPSQARSSLDPRWDSVLLKALEKSPDQRYPDMPAFEAALASLGASLGASPGASLAASEGEHEASERLAALTDAIASERCALILGESPPAEASHWQRLARLPWSLVISLRPVLSLEQALHGLGIEPLGWQEPHQPLHAEPHQLPVLTLALPELSGGELALQPGQPTLLSADRSPPLRDPSEPAEKQVQALETLFSQLERLDTASDGLRARLATSSLLYLGVHPAQVSFRQLHARLTRLRPSGANGCYCVLAESGAASLRWAERHGVQVLAHPLPLLLASLAEIRVKDGSYRPTLTLPDRPYKKLDYFEAEDEAIFFGRETETQRLMDQILARSVTVIYGTSGAGKTSLLRAGVMPRLQRRGMRAVYARVFNDPMQELVREVSRVLTSGDSSGAAPGRQGDGRGDSLEPAPAGSEDSPQASALSRLPQSLSADDVAPWLAAQANATSLLILVLDQLEELFTRLSRPQREELALTLKQALNLSEGKLRVVFSLRSDYLGHIVELEPWLPSPLQNVFFLGPLPLAAARDAMLRPAHALGFELEGALVDQILEDVKHEDIDPPQLQLVCDALFEALPPGQTQLTLRMYQALGCAEGILRHHLDQVLSTLPEHAWAPVRRLLKAMVTSENLKTVRRVEEICRLAALSETEAAPYLALLNEKRLVRPVVREDGAWLELSHEYLVNEISSWLSEQERQLQTVRELLEQGMRSHRRLGLLLSAEQLRLIEEHASFLALTGEEEEVIRTSRAAAHQQRRRWQQRLLLGFVLLMLVPLTGVGIWRYQLLASSLMLQVSPFEAQWTRTGDSSRQVISNVKLLRGRVDAWAIDRFLGYPVQIYESDFNLDHIKPGLRAGLLSGVQLDPARSIDEQMLEMIQPVERVRQLLLLGRMDEAAELFVALAGSPLSIPQELLTLLPTFAVASQVPEVMVKPVLDVAARYLEVVNAVNEDVGRTELIGTTLAPFLRRVSRSVWEPQLRAFATDEGGLYFVMTVLRYLATDEELPLILRALDSPLETASRSAWLVLRSGGLCGALPKVRRALESSATRELDLESALIFMRDCGGKEDIGRLEALLPQILQSTDSLALQLYRLIYSVYGLDRQAGARLLEKALHSPGGLRGLDLLMDSFGNQWAPELVEVCQRHFRNIPHSQWPLLLLKSSAELGDAAVVPELWRRIMADPRQGGVRDLVRTVTVFAGVDAPLLTRGGGSSDPTFGLFRSARLEYLFLRPSDEAVLELVEIASSYDSTMQFGALDILTIIAHPRTEALLHQILAGPDGTRRLVAAFVLQAREQKSYGDVFRTFLSSVQPSSSILDVRTSIRGLAVALQQEPIEHVWPILRSPQYWIRLAGALSLYERTDGSALVPELRRWSHSSDAVERLTGARTLWAIMAGESNRAQAANFARLLTEGKPRAADQQFRSQESPISGAEQTLEMALAPQFQNAISEPEWVGVGQLRLINLLRERTPGRTRRFGRPAFLPRVAADPWLKELHHFYAFRVVVGEEALRTVASLVPDGSLPGPHPQDVPVRGGRPESVQ